MDYKTKRLNNAIAEAKALCDSLNIPYGNIKWVKINTRAKSRWGQCKLLKTGGFEIQIADVLLDPHTSHEALMDTVIHEVLHTCPGGMTHKGAWKMYADKVNRNTQYNIKRCTSAAEKNLTDSTAQIKRELAKYEVTCLKCGSIYRYKRAGTVVQSLLTKPINSYCSCPRCKGSDFKVRTLV